MKKIIAYSQSNSQIGSGHLVRTAQLLSCLDKKLFSVDFYCDYEKTPKWFSKIDHYKISIENFFEIDFNEYDILIFDSYTNRNLLKNVAVDVLLIDDYSYFSNNSYADIILDYNYGSSLEFYSQNDVMLGPTFFPISENSFPEYLNKISWDKNSENILLSLGGVSDAKLLNIEHYITLASKFGKVYLMDPLSKLESFKNENVILIQDMSLSEILSNLDFYFGIIAGGTSKYITSAYGLPCLFVGRNELEKILIDKFIADRMAFNESFLHTVNDNNDFDSVLEKISKNTFKLLSENNSKKINNFLNSYR